MDSTQIAEKISTLDLSSDKRDNYLPWEDYFLAVAFLSAMRSKDPSTQVIFFNKLKS